MIDIRSSTAVQLMYVRILKKRFTAAPSSSATECCYYYGVGWLVQKHSVLRVSIIGTFSYDFLYIMTDKLFFLLHPVLSFFYLFYNLMFYF